MHWLHSINVDTETATYLLILLTQQILIFRGIMVWRFLEINDKKLSLLYKLYKTWSMCETAHRCVGNTLSVSYPDPVPEFWMIAAVDIICGCGGFEVV